MSKAARKKEEERIEKIIRNLLKLPENRRCINCNSLGPQYVCTTFWTFVCTNCSGLHREFTHRVKSISMAKFSAEEISALQAGGNERAREIYFKDWDIQRHSFPDGSNQNRLRNFIKHVYVDRKFTGEVTPKLAMVKPDVKEDPVGRRSIDSPSYGRRSADSGSKYYVDERSPRNQSENVKSSSHRNRPIRFEIVDDRFRDDDHGCGRRSEVRRSYNLGPGVEGMPSFVQKGQEKMRLPAVQSVKHVLGEDVPPLQVGKSPEDNDCGEDNRNTGQLQKAASLSDPTPVNAKPLESGTEKSVSLINLIDDAEPPDPIAALQPPQTTTSTSTVKDSNTPQVNSLELMLFELSDPVPRTVDIASKVPGNIETPNAAPAVGDMHETSSVGMEPMLLSSGSDSITVTNDGSQLASSGDIRSTSQQLTAAGVSLNQTWSCSPAPDALNSFSVAQDITSQTGLQAHSAELKSSGKGELPADLFSVSYPLYPAPPQGWQSHPPYGMGYNMQYSHAMMAGPALPYPVVSRNPFDLNDDINQLQTSMPPSMQPVQVAASPYQAMAPLQYHTYGMSQVLGALSRPQLSYSEPLSRPEEDCGVGRAQDPFASLTPFQQRSHENSTPSTANFFTSAGGNPFA